MLFNTAQFAVFFALVLATYLCLPKRHRNPLLLGASLAFYTLWSPVYLLLLLADILVNFVLLQRIAKSNRPRLYLALSVVFTIGLLARFKYAAMIVATALPALDSFFAVQLEVPALFIPLGISFYSFQILALSFDTYRGQIEPIRSFPRYALFISFFPQLIAGPILRGEEFLPQLERGGVRTRDRTRRGIWLIVVGLAKKIILADYLLKGFVDQVFEAQSATSSALNLLALYSFAFQIYYDFSGYTNMARGMALLLGFELPANFKEPYLSKNPSEFWRRWHITLSRWLADYLYIPLGGSRRGRARTYINLSITMLLGGLWHGASWSFVVWGGLHGLLLIGYRIFARAKSDAEEPTVLRDALSILVHFHLVTLIWVFFRAESFEAAASFLANLFMGNKSYGLPTLQLGIVLLCACLHWLERYLRLRLPALREALAKNLFGSALEGALAGALIGLSVMTSGAGGDFIYFQF